MSDSISSLSSVTSLADMTSLFQKRNVELHAATGKPAQEQLREAAKNFEAVLVEKLMQEMQNTVMDSGMFSDAGTKQMQSMFWSFLSEQVAQNGGIGLAENLYRDFCRSAGVDPSGETPASVGPDGQKDISPPRVRGLAEKYNAAKFLEMHSAPQSHVELKR